MFGTPSPSYTPAMRWVQIDIRVDRYFADFFKRFFETKRQSYIANWVLIKFELVLNSLMVHFLFLDHKNTIV